MSQRTLERGAERTAVARYYDEKTARLIEKYGPGPRVHFHTGLVDDDPPAGANGEELRRGMVQAQERLLLEALDAWGRDAFLGHVVDVGCGLGGTLLLWLKETPAERVTGITIAPAHEAVVHRFAEEEGAASRVSVEVCDASAIPGEARFDAAVSVEASCYFDREAWLSCMRRVLKPGARVYLIDCFLGRDDVGPAFDDYWLTRIGTLSSYDAAAGANGFVLEDVVELNERCRRFWDWSLAYTRSKLEEASDPALEENLAFDERRRLLRSQQAHEHLRDTFSDGGIRYLRAVLRRA